MTTKNAKPATVFVLQLQPIASANAKGDEGVPVSPTTLVYGTEDALMQGLRRIFAAEYKRLKARETFEKDLDRARGSWRPRRDWDVDAWHRWNGEPGCPSGDF